MATDVGGEKRARTAHSIGGIQNALGRGSTSEDGEDAEIVDSFFFFFRSSDNYINHMSSSHKIFFFPQHKYVYRERAGEKETGGGAFTYLT